MFVKQGWKKCKISLDYGQQFHQKCDSFTNYQNFWYEKDQNIHLTDKFPLKIAKMSLQKQNYNRCESGPIALRERWDGHSVPV